MKNNKPYLIAAICVVVGLVLIFLSAKFAKGDWRQYASTNPAAEYEVKHYSCSSDINSIEINESSNEVSIIKGNVDKVTVEYYYKDGELDYSFNESNGKFMMNRKESSHNWHISFGFNVNLDWPHITVTVPEKDFDAIQVKLSSGSVFVDGLKLDELLVKNSSGTISVSNISANDIDVENTSGLIKLSSINAEQIIVENTSGGLKLDEVNSKTIETTSTSGSTKFDKVTTDKLSSKTTSGSIKLDKVSSPDITLKASSGSIHGTIVGDENDYTIFADTTSGSCNLKDHLGTSKSLKCNTTSGNINISFE